MKKQKQLSLVFNDLATKIDPLAEQLHNTIYAMKTFAYRVECSMGPSHPAFNKIKDLAEALGRLSYQISPLTNKYFHTTEKDWLKKTVYNPIYGPIEPKSALELYIIALDYNSRLKRLILQLERLTKQPYDKVLDLSLEIVKDFYDEKFEL